MKEPNRSAGLIKQVARRVSQTLRPAGSATGPMRLSLEAKELRLGHTLQLLVDGEHVFPAMLAAIASAQKSIWLESYIFESDKTGKCFIQALAKRAKEGVEVLILLDAFGSMEFDSDDAQFLRRAGAQVEFFGRFNHLDVSRWLKRDHRKLLLVDHQQAFVGGINISDDYASKAWGGKGWHDLHVAIEGPVCQVLSSVFSKTWKRASRRQLPLPNTPGRTPPDDTGEWAMALCSTHSGVRMRIRSHLLHALRNAEHEVLLASAYFVPDRGLLRALEAAAKRGVELRLLVPAESDVEGVQRAGEYSYQRLLTAGIHIHPYQGRHMHAKAAVVDRRWCTFGSYNLDFASLLYNLELMIEVVGDQTPSALADQLRHDFSISPELQIEEWKQRPLSSKLYSTLAYQFRRIL